MKKILFFLSTLLFCIFQHAYAREPDDKASLSLEEAILLAVRSNPNVQTNKLRYIQDKFSLWVEQWKFYPQFTFQASATAGQTAAAGQPVVTTKGFNATPSVSLLTPIGTQISVKTNNPVGDHYNPGIGLQITQPLMRGFGRPIVEAALKNAQDSELISRLNIESTLRNTVTEVINAYLEVVNSEKTLTIDEDAVKRAEESVEQTKLFIKAGHKAGNELITVQANVASARTKIESDKNNLAQARYALLTAIGLDPNTDIRFTSLNLDHLIRKYRLPSLDETKLLTLENDINYQTSQITLHGTTRRALVTAKDNTRWRLDLNLDASTGNGRGGGWNSGINSLFNQANHSTGVGLTLQIPIFDQLAKQSVLQAKIALKNAEIGLKKERWSKETTAINGWNSVLSAERSLHFAEDAEKLQRKTYSISYQKYLHGLIDSLELQTAQVQLIQAEQTLLGARIAYLKALVNLDNLIGNTLKTWDIKMRC